MVYYHRIGDWSDYPNLFNPYWRAKLQPHDPGRVAAVMAVDNDAAQVAAARWATWARTSPGSEHCLLERGAP